MNLSAVLIPIFVIIGFIMNDTKKNRRNYTIFCSLVLMLTVALRSITVGYDTENYYLMYEQVANMSLNEVWQSFLDRYINHTSEIDFGYILFEKLISLISTDFHVFVFISNLTFFIPLSIFLIRFAADKFQILFAFVFYIVLIHVIALCGGRQFFAIGLCMMAYLEYERKKYIRMTVWFIVAMLIHMSALLAVLPILLDKLNCAKIKKIHILTFCLIPIVLIYVNQFIFLMGDAVGSEKFAAYGNKEVGGGTETFITLLVCVSIFCYFTLKQELIQNDKRLKFLYCMIPGFTLLGPTIYSNGTMIRTSMYFHLYIMLLIPYGIDVIAKQNRKLFYLLAISALYLLSVRSSGFGYYFFWELDHPTTW